MLGGAETFAVDTAGGLYALAKQLRESRDLKPSEDRPPTETTEGGVSEQNVN